MNHYAPDERVRAGVTLRVPTTRYGTEARGQPPAHHRFSERPCLETCSDEALNRSDARRYKLSPYHPQASPIIKRVHVVVLIL